MGSVNVADSELEDVICEDGDPDSELEWDKNNESFTEFFCRLKRRAEDQTVEAELTEDQEEDLVNNVERLIQKYSGR